MDAGSIDHGKRAVVGRKACQRAVCLDDMEPLGKQQIDLFDVLLERGIAGRIGVCIKRRAQTLGGVQHHVGRLQVGFAVQRAVQLALGLLFQGGRFGKCAVPLCCGSQIQALHGLHAQQPDYEKNAENRAKQS